jgi:hypothetical protein
MAHAGEFVNNANACNTSRKQVSLIKSRYFLFDQNFSKNIKKKVNNIFRKWMQHKNK